MSSEKDTGGQVPASGYCQASIRDGLVEIIDNECNKMEV
jgi:hypothetical protein